MHPNPNELYPISGSKRTVFLKGIIKNPNIIVGDYTYYDDPIDVHNIVLNEGQRLYIKMGYFTDGNDITYQNKFVEAGNSYPINDDLLLWLSQKL